MTTPTYRHLVHPRTEIVAAIERIYQYRMTTTSGGNLSILDESGGVWITPAGIDKGSLRAEDIVRVGRDGSVSGRHRPSSEFPFHRAIYDVRPDLRAVVHAHPVALVAFSIARKAPDTALLPLASEVCGTVAFAPYHLPGSEALGTAIAETFATGCNSVMLENHGVVVGGENLQQAFKRFETLEFCAKTAIKGALIGTVKHLTPDQINMGATFTPLEGHFTPGVASTAEKEARQLVADFVRRGYRQRLMTSTEGSCSARLGPDEFVITCRGVDRGSATPESLALIRGGLHEVGKNPSRATKLHRAIYAKHPGVKSIINAMPVNATAFAVTGEKLDARTIPESYIFLREIETLPFGMHLVDPERVAEKISPEKPVMLIENDGVLVLGRGVLDAFDRLEVLESTAEALINSRAVGPVHPMDDAAIDELVTAFIRPWE